MSSRASVDVADQHNDELVLLAQLVASLLLKWRHFVLSSKEESEHTTCVLDAPLYFRTSKHSQVGRGNYNKENWVKTWNKNVIEHHFARQEEKQQADKEEREPEHYNNHCENSRKSKLCQYLPRLHWLTHLTKRSLSVHSTRHEVAHKLFDSEESCEEEESETSCRCCKKNNKCKCKEYNKNNVSEPSYLSSQTIKQIISDVECVLNGMSVLQDDESRKHTKSSKEVRLIQSLLAECERLQHRYKNLQHEMRQITEQRLSQKEPEETDKRCECTQTKETLPTAQHNNKKATVEKNRLAHKAKHVDNNVNGVLLSNALEEVQKHNPHMKTQMEWEHEMREYMEAEINALDSYYKKEQKKNEESWECEREQLIEAFTKEYKEIYCLLQEQECKWKVNEQHALQQEETNERLRIVNECELELINIVQSYYKSLFEWGKQRVHNANTITLPLTSEYRHGQELSKYNHVNKNTAFLFDHNAESPSSVNMEHRHTFHTLPRVPLDNDTLHYAEKTKEKENQEVHIEERKEEKCKSTNTAEAAAEEHSAPSTSHANNSKHEETKLEPAHVHGSTSASTLTSFDPPLSNDANKQPNALLLSASALPLLSSSLSSTTSQRYQQHKTEKQEELEHAQLSFVPVHFPWQNETSNFTSFKAYCHTRGLPTHSESFAHFLSNELKNTHQCGEPKKEKFKRKSEDLCYHHANNANADQNTKNVDKYNDVCNKVIPSSTITNNNNNNSKSCLATPHRTSHVVKSLLLSPLDDRLSNVPINGVVSEIISPKKSSSNNSHYHSEPDKCHESKDAAESEKEVTLQTLSRQLTASPSISATFANHLPHHRLMSPSPENEYLEEEEEEQEERDAFDNYEHHHYYHHNGWNNEETCNRQQRETRCQSKEEEEKTHTEQRQPPSLGLVNSYVENSNVDIVNILEQQTE